MKSEQGGPAFPFVVNDGFYSGMSLRDYFAAKAMTAIIGKGNYLEDVSSKKIAEWSYGFADEMLEEREKDEMIEEREKWE
jgi:hypothetical protein